MVMAVNYALKQSSSSIVMVVGCQNKHLIENLRLKLLIEDEFVFLGTDH